MADPTDWAAEKRKWDRGIDLNKHNSTGDLTDFMRFKVHEWGIRGWKDTQLWEDFRDEFGNFTLDHFHKLSKKDIRELKNTLLRCGVFVGFNLGEKGTISDFLMKIIKDDSEHQWTQEEIDAIEQLNGPFSSPKILATIKNRDRIDNTNRNNVPPPPQGNNNPPPQRSGYGKEIANLSKMYTEEQQYGGIGGESFDYKLTIFKDLCSRTEIPSTAYSLAFPCMLKGTAKDQYYVAKASTLSFDEACNRIKGFFEGPGYYRRTLDEWNATTLQTYINLNSGKLTVECLNQFTTKLRTLQHGLDPDLRKSAFMHNKLIQACESIPACSPAVIDPPASIGDLIHKLQSSITAYEKQASATNPESYYTDRRYYSRNQERDSRDYHNHSRDRRSRYDRPRRIQRCFVCQKEGCRSYKHTETEREESKAKFKTENRGRFKRLGEHFDKGFKQYVTEYEGASSDSESEDEVKEAFQSLIIESKTKTRSPSPSPNRNADFAQYYTSIGDLTALQALQAANQLADKAFTHSITAEDPTSPPTPQIETFITTSGKPRYSSDEFMGIIIDTGAAKYSTAGYGQFIALKRLDDSVSLDITTKGRATVQFGIGSTSSIGSITVSTPIGKIDFHVVEANTPFLLCLADMDHLQLRFDNIKNILISPTSSIPVARRFGHAFLLWDTSLHSFLSESFSYNPCFLTEVELARLHRRFGHPSVERLRTVLERSGHSVELEAIEHLTRYCRYCQKHGKSPGRFRFTLRDDVSFNYNIVVDVLYIENRPTLHIVDEATRFQAGRFLKDISAKHTWETLRTCWIDTYLGPPDLITHDAGKNFASKEFKQYAGNMSISVKPIPVEAHNSIGMVERYHGPLRRAYQIIVAEIPGIDPDFALQMAFKAINDSAGPNGIVPTLLVFGAYPRMTELDAPSPTVTQRSVALKKAMEEIKKLRAQRQVADALNTRNGPNTSAIQDLPLNSPVLVWREGNGGQTGSWKGPYTMLSVDQETVTIELPHGPTAFRSTVVKPYLQDPNKQSDPQQASADETPSNTPAATPPTSTAANQAVPPKRGRGRPRKYPAAVNTADIVVYLQEEGITPAKGQFTTSRQKEIAGLLEMGVFEIVDRSKVPEGVRIFNSRFVDQVKNEGTDKAFEKSRIVVQAYNDEGKDLVLTQSPTIQRVSQRLIICLAAMLRDNDTELYLRDITQAYVQSKSTLNRDFYIRPPPELGTELGIARGAILKVIKPLYGVPEAGNHWFATYHKHHTRGLGMEQSTYDPCLLYRNDESSFGIIGLQTDDTLILANQEFARLEQAKIEAEKLLSKDREPLSADKPIKFNGGLIQVLPTGDLLLSQENQCKNLGLVSTKVTSSTSSRGVVRPGLSLKDQYVAQRARGAYIGSVSQPEAAFDLSFAAQVINPDVNNAKELNKRIQWQIDNSSRGLKFVKLDKNSLQLLVFTDSSFANNTDLSSQIGYVVVLADSTGKANIIHWSSIKCKRVTRSVLASELYAMTHGFDIAAVVKSTIDRALQIVLPLTLCTDSKSLYDCLVKLGTTQEKRLMIDIICLRQSYERREIAEVKWIDGDTNPADSMTKSKACSALKQLIDTNKVDLRTVEWVER